jgi:hypothetical protein
VIPLPHRRGRCGRRSTRRREKRGSISVPARLDQIIHMKRELVQLAGKLDWDWLDGAIAPLYGDKGRPGIETRFVIGAAVAQAHLCAIRGGGGV